jgi:hypothetical protein
VRQWTVAVYRGVFGTVSTGDRNSDAMVTSISRIPN